MVIRYSFALALAMWGLAITPIAQGVPDHQPPPTFRSALDVVTIHASVRDRQGRLITGLTPSDFEIRDNGQIRPILSLRSDRDSPISLAFLVDMSGSMRLSGKTAMARQAYGSVLSQLRQGHDEAALFTFDEALHERRGFTRDIDSLSGALSDFDAYGATSLYDASAAVARRLAALAGSNKAIVVITDGADTSSRMSAGDVSGLAASVDVPVFVVATVPVSEQRPMAARGPRTASDGADLRDLAAWTGGEFIFASTFDETAGAATQLIADLRHQYLLGIESAGDREWRRLDVRVRRPASIVKARTGYYGG
jgi:Mg-chelatase subunit ChlD